MHDPSSLFTRALTAVPLRYVPFSFHLRNFFKTNFLSSLSMGACIEIYGTTLVLMPSLFHITGSGLYIGLYRHQCIRITYDLDSGIIYLLTIFFIQFTQRFQSTDSGKSESTPSAFKRHWLPSFTGGLSFTSYYEGSVSMGVSPFRLSQSSIIIANCWVRSLLPHIYLMGVLLIHLFEIPRTSCGGTVISM